MEREVLGVLSGSAGAEPMGNTDRFAARIERICADFWNDRVTDGMRGESGRFEK